ncbi:MAG: hypothetical protein PHX27_01015 [Candidatus ainarchaeum sp.]|nr:hypothetical protein [Candidatus ainarchaeum sp.]
MVFGLFEKGKIELNLNKFNFTQGEVIEGNLKMKLKKPANAKGIFLTIFAEQTTQNANIGGIGVFGMQPISGRKTSTSIGGIGTSKTTTRAFEFTQQIDGEKEYGIQEYNYDFKINVPNQNTQSKMEGPMSGIANTLKMFTIGNQYTKWFIEAKLDIPKGIDVGKKIQINIT